MANESVWLLAELASELNTAADLPTLQVLLGKRLRWLFDFDRCTLVVQWTAQDEALLLCDISAPSRQGQAWIPRGDNWPSLVLAQAKPIFIPDTAHPNPDVTYPTDSELGLVAGARSLMLLPLRSGDRQLGCLCLCSKQPEMYTTIRRNLAMLFAAQLEGTLGSVMAREATLAALEALKVSEVRFRGLIEQMPVGVLLHGPKGDVITSNPAAQALLQRSETQLEGQPLGAIAPTWLQTDGTPLAIADHPVSQAIAHQRSVPPVVLGLLPGGQTLPLTSSSFGPSSFGPSSFASSPRVPSLKDPVPTGQDSSLDATAISTTAIDVTALDATAMTWVLVSAEPLLGPGQVICTLSDITERRQAEARLVQTTRLLTSLLTNLQAGILVRDSQQRTLHVNQAFCQMIAAPLHPAQLTGQSLDVLWCDPTLAQDSPLGDWLAQLPVIEAQQRPVTAALVTLADGRLLEQDYVPVPLGDRQWVHLWEFRDVTERHRAEQQKQQQLERQRLLAATALQIRQSLNLSDTLQATVTAVRQVLNADRVVIYCFDADQNGQVIAESVGEAYPSALGAVLANPWFAPMREHHHALGLSHLVPTDLIGTDWADQVQAIDSVAQAPLVAAHRQFLQDLQIQATLVVPITQDENLWGLLATHQCSAPRTWLPADKQLLMQLAVQVAIAIRQARLYEEVQQLNQNLEHKVRLRTLQIQRQLSELERLNRLKDDFLSTVSHELRTPMTNLRMATHLLQATVAKLQVSEPEATALQRYLGILKTECSREIDLINDLLDLQRLETGAQPLHLDVLDLASWLPEVVTPFQDRAQARQQTLAIHIESYHLPPLSTDPTALKRILSELLNNACKYTSPGGWITFTVEPIHQPQPAIRCQVANAAQISPTVLPHIFDKFYRGPQGDPWQQGGTGLGLSLCQELVQQLQGSLTATSQQGKTTFTLLLPI